MLLLLIHLQLLKETKKQSLFLLSYSRSIEAKHPSDPSSPQRRSVLILRFVDHCNFYPTIQNDKCLGVCLCGVFFIFTVQHNVIWQYHSCWWNLSTLNKKMSHTYSSLSTSTQNCLQLKPYFLPSALSFLG